MMVVIFWSDKRTIENSSKLNGLDIDLGVEPFRLCPLC